jgi:hypothetical protein
VYTGFVGPNGTSDGSTINVSYFAPISNSPNIPPGLDVAVDATGSFSGKITGVTVDKSLGTVQVLLNGLPPNAADGTITIRSVRLNLSNLSPPGYASVGGSGFSFFAGQNLPTIINSIMPCASQPPASITSILPATAMQGSQVTATIMGTNLVDANGSAFGPYPLFSGTGIHFLRGNSTDTTVQVTINVDSNATPGTRSLFVTKLGSVSNGLTFTITAAPKQAPPQLTSQ